MSRNAANDNIGSHDTPMAKRKPFSSEDYLANLHRKMEGLQNRAQSPSMFHASPIQYQPQQALNMLSGPHGMSVNSGIAGTAEGGAAFYNANINQ